jgi:hypothetical protein
MTEKKLFKLKQGSFPLMLKSAIDEAREIIGKRQKIYTRHCEEIEDFRLKDRETKNSFSEMGGVKKAVADLILRYAEHSDAKYEAHCLRVKIAVSVKNGELIDIDSLFEEARSHFGIAPIYGVILDANRTLESVYDFGNRNEMPKLDFLMFDFLDIEVAVLRLYVAYADQFGLDYFARELAAKHAEN